MLYLGADPVPYAVESLRAASQAGMRQVYVTNNTSRSPQAVVDHLRRLGVPARQEDVATSGQAAAGWLAQRLDPATVVLVVGSDALLDLIAQAGLVPVRSADRAPAAVVQGLSMETGWTELAEAAVTLHAGALWVAGNADNTLPTARGLLPGNGAFVAALQATTGRWPVVVGKPEPELHRVSVARVGARRPLVVGDRLDTDILGAVRADADSMLVLTGVVDARALMAAPRGCRPTYVARDLRGLVHVHPQVHTDGDQARCREAHVAWTDKGVQVRSRGQDDDALRACCALAWERADRGAAGGSEQGTELEQVQRGRLHT